MHYHRRRRWGDPLQAPETPVLALPHVEPAFGHWLAGFIDGEGCFTIERTGPGGRGWCCRFVLVLRDDDGPIVEEIIQRTGLGRAGYSQKARRYNRKANPQVAWRVDGRVQCAALMNLLDAHPLRAKKASDYAIWREAVIHWLTLSPQYRNGFGQSGMQRYDWGPIPELRDRLVQGRAYRPQLGTQLPLVRG